MEDTPFTHVTPIKNLTDGKPLPKGMLEDHLDEPDKVPEGLQHWKIMSQRQKWYVRCRALALVLAVAQLAWVPWLYAVVAVMVLVTASLAFSWLMLRHYNKLADTSAEQADQRLQQMIKPIPHIHTHETQENVA